MLWEDAASQLETMDALLSLPNLRHFGVSLPDVESIRSMSLATNEARKEMISCIAKHAHKFESFGWWGYLYERERTEIYGQLTSLTRLKCEISSTQFLDEFISWKNIHDCTIYILPFWAADRRRNILRVIKSLSEYLEDCSIIIRQASSGTDSGLRATKTLRIVVYPGSGIWQSGVPPWQKVDNSEVVQLLKCFCQKVGYRFWAQSREAASYGDWKTFFADPQEQCNFEANSH